MDPIMKNTEGFCKTQDGDNVFSRPVTNFLKILWKLKIFGNLVKMKIFENLAKIEDFSNFGQNWRVLKIWSKLKIFHILVKIEDFWKICQNWRFGKFA